MGKIFSGVIKIAVTLFALGYILPVLWPYIEDTTTSMSELTGTSGSILATMWPVILVVAAVCIGIGVIYWGLKDLGIIGGKKT
jgi:hypothetical protein